MKKFIRILIPSIVIISYLCIGDIFIDGYYKYKEAISTISLHDKVNEIKNSKDYEPIKNINKNFLDAIVSIEDHRFYNHNGVDFISIIRATINNLAEGKIVQGGSTITQQLAKNLYFDSDKNFSRKVAEVFLVHDLEKNYTKYQILEMYVNIINYGDNHIGIKEASNGYFDVEPSDLNLNEASILAGLPQCPNGYALSKHYDKAIARQKQVLEAMNVYNDISHNDEYYVLGDINYAI